MHKQNLFKIFLAEKACLYYRFVVVSIMIKDKIHSFRFVIRCSHCFILCISVFFPISIRLLIQISFSSIDLTAIQILLSLEKYVKGISQKNGLSKTKFLYLYYDQEQCSLIKYVCCVNLDMIGIIVD